MKNIIEINHLSKSFGEVKAVQDLSFRVKEGELFAFLGVNGAGKSTTINIMCAQLTKDSGSIVIDGYDLDKNVDGIKRELGVVFQNSVLDGALSVYDNLQSRAALYGIIGDEFKSRLDELSELLDLDVIGQINAKSLEKSSSRRACFKLIKKGYVHAIGSDYHRIDSTHIQVADAFSILDKKFGDGFTDDLMKNQVYILKNESIGFFY